MSGGAMQIEEVLDFLADDIVHLRNDGTITIACDAGTAIPGMTSICPGELGGPFERAVAEAMEADEALDGEGGNPGPFVVVEMS